MARRVRDATLDTPAARAKLKPQGKPYYRLIDRGLHLGYRKGVKGAGRWVVRWYAGAQAYKVETIGTADDLSDADGVRALDYWQAQKLARERATSLARAATGQPDPAGPYTVRQSLNDYIEWLEAERKSAADARSHAEVHILPALGSKNSAELTTAGLRRWLHGLAKEPARVRGPLGQGPQLRKVAAEEDDDTTRRRRATANRVLTTLRAALNYAWRDGRVASDSAWRRVKPFKAVDAARVRYLSLDECRRLANGAAPEFRKLVRAALLTGCRYGELARLQVVDVNPDAGTVAVRQSKGGKPRHVILTDEGRKLFAELTAGRKASEILLQHDGRPWRKSAQVRPMAAACTAARLEPPATFHALRHTYGTLAIMSGVPLLVVARNLGHVDTRMVERHYGHMAPSYEAEAIRKGVPNFGFPPDENVVPITGVPAHG